MEYHNNGTEAGTKSLFDRNLLHYILKNAKFAIVAALVLAIIAYAFTALGQSESYTATTRIYVLPFEELEYVEAQFSTIFINDCKSLISGDTVADSVISKLSLDMTPADLVGSVKVTTQSNSRVLQIDVTADNEDLAVSLANAVREESIAHIEAVIDVVDIRTVNEAEHATLADSSSPITSAILAAAVGFILFVCALAVIYLLDETIRTDSDVTDCLGVCVLGSIPDSHEAGIGSASVKN